MKRQARLKSTGEIIEVRVSMDYRGHATWVEDATKTEYYQEELEFLDNDQSLNSETQIENLISCDPLQMEFDPQTMIAQASQTLHVRFNKLIIQEAIKHATDKQLKEELKRRTDERRALKGQILRCRNCKHCINGYTTARAWFRNETTAVCALKPKPKAGENCHYSTSHSNRACEKFELKHNT